MLQLRGHKRCCVQPAFKGAQRSSDRLALKLFRMVLGFAVFTQRIESAGHRYKT